MAPSLPLCDQTPSFPPVPPPPRPDSRPLRQVREVAGAVDSADGARAALTAAFRDVRMGLEVLLRERDEARGQTESTRTLLARQVVDLEMELARVRGGAPPAAPPPSAGEGAGAGGAGAGDYAARVAEVEADRDAWRARFQDLAQRLESIEAGGSERTRGEIEKDRLIGMLSTELRRREEAGAVPLEAFRSLQMVKRGLEDHIRLQEDRVARLEVQCGQQQRRIDELEAGAGRMRKLEEEIADKNTAIKSVERELSDFKRRYGDVVQARQSSAQALFEEAVAQRAVFTRDGPEFQAIIDHAKHLGIDPVEEPHLLWVAEESLAAPLPDGWVEHSAEGGDIFFVDEVTGTTTWTHPLDDYFRFLYAQVRERMRAKGPVVPGTVTQRALRLVDEARARSQASSAAGFAAQVGRPLSNAAPASAGPPPGSGGSGAPAPPPADAATYKRPRSATATKIEGPPAGFSGPLFAPRADLQEWPAQTPKPLKPSAQWSKGWAPTPVLQPVLEQPANYSLQQQQAGTPRAAVAPPTPKLHADEEEARLYPNVLRRLP
eukprot:tig00020943_g16337.t1